MDKACHFLRIFYQETVLPKLQNKDSNSSSNNSLSTAYINTSNNLNVSSEIQSTSGCVGASNIQKVQNRSRNKDSSYLLNSIMDTAAPCVRNNADEFNDEIEEYKNIRFKYQKKM